jgi:signal transduction histidine kinase
MKRKTAEFLRRCGIDLPFSVTTPVGKLSGGQRRILSILRAYYFGRKLLILDEPTAALSEHEVEIVLNLVKKAKSEGTAVIFITHKEHEVFQVADRFFILYQGNQYMIINRKYSFLNRVSSLLISSRVLAVQDIAAEIVYQFSQPLRDMRANVERLSHDYEVINDPDLYFELVNTLMTEIRSLTSIIYHLSHLSEEPEVARSEVHVRNLLESVIAEIPPALRSRMRFDISVENGLSCFMDRDIIQQVLINLINNAIEASEEGGRIELSAVTGKSEGRRDGIVLRVRDRGRGMDEAMLEDVFNPFFTTKPSNSGLGLSIVYKLLEIEDGSIDVSSSPGDGTEFTVHLHRRTTGAGA